MARKIFGTDNKKKFKELELVVEAINWLEPAMKGLEDHELQAYTGKFRERLEKGETLDDLLVEAFAVVRETADRTLNMRPFDVQLLGGIVLHRGKIAEMKTGEGKTLVATLPAYLNALEGKGVHIATVNDYLARRDAEWMGPIYKFLGLSVGVIQHNMDRKERQEAYNCDILYSTNNELGFDYLNDNTEMEKERPVQRELNYVIVDEVDYILIDEARIPLIISGAVDESDSTSIKQVNDFVESALEEPGNYELDEKSGTVVLTERGIDKAEKFLNLDNLFELENIGILHQINQSLKAHLLFSRDVDYLVKDNRLVIVDEFTGRMMPGRRFSDGMHQALEAKEGLTVEKDSQIYAKITFQNFFRLYKKLAGMTGTAATEAKEFHSVYQLEVIEIPTNKKLIREEEPDVIYGTKVEKWHAVVKEIKRLYQRQQPVLVGTVSIENSELLSRRMLEVGIPHEVLNAKYHDIEAEIVAQAGRLGAVTIATNMAGRGTDIMLGGNPEKILKQKLKEQGYDEKSAPRPIYEKLAEETQQEVKEEREKVISLGGLYILGTERHEARRIDNQLRGRAGRQGDPGSSRFFISLEDDLMKIIGLHRIKNLIHRINVRYQQPIRHKLVTRLIENAQALIENRNFLIRKHLLEYDDVINKQREYIYHFRREVLMAKDIKQDITRLIDDTFAGVFNSYFYEDHVPDRKGYISMHKQFFFQFGMDINEILTQDYGEMPTTEIKDTLLNHIKKIYREKEQLLGAEKLRKTERETMLLVIDSHWKDHLINMKHLESDVDLRSYARKNPLVEFKREGYELFRTLQDQIEKEVLRFLFLFSEEEEEKGPSEKSD